MARSKRWYWAVGEPLLGEIDRVAKALGLDRADVVRQAVQGGLTILLGDVPEDEPQGVNTEPPLTANEGVNTSAVNTSSTPAEKKSVNTEPGRTLEQLAALGIGSGPSVGDPFGASSDDA